MAINAETKTIDVTFSNYTAGTQYAKNEAHVINESLTIYTTECHFTTELRIYSSSTHNGYAVSNELPGAITQMTFNAGNKKDVLNVYGSTDGSSWELVEGITTSTNYTDYSLDFPTNSSYTYFKLDVEGNQQIRIKKMSVTYTTSTGGGEEPGEGGGEEPGEDPIEPETPSLPEGTLYYESFDQCNTQGGNDGNWAQGSGTIKFDNENNTHVKGFGANKCARFGSGDEQGSFTTATIAGLGNVEGGYAILTFKAAPWDNSKETNTIQVSINNGGNFISETSALTMTPGSWTDYSLGIAGGTANTTITISAVKESKNRFFLDEVKVMASTEDKVTGIEDTMVDENAPVEYYNLQGVKVANPENGIFIKKQGGRTSKVVL